MVRGFGFITFKDPASVSKVLETHAQEPIVLDDKNVRGNLLRSSPTRLLTNSFVQIDPKIAVPPKRPGNKAMSPPWTAPSQVSAFVYILPLCGENVYRVVPQGLCVVGIVAK